MTTPIIPAPEAAVVVPRPDPEVLHLRREAYWHANLAVLGGLLTAWGAVSYGAGIVFVDVLDQYTLLGSGFPLGFWFAQQGSIYGFLAIIVIYVRVMNRLDRRFGFDE